MHPLAHEHAKERTLISSAEHTTAIARVAPWVARRPWLLIAAPGAFVHLGTALLRLGTFLPYPRLIDLASFLGGAWALRLGVSPYTEGPAVMRLREATGLAFPLTNSPPGWLLMFVPLTLLPFPVAAALWLGVLLAVTALSAHLLADAAGCQHRYQRALVFLGVVTFGPTFLNLTLGQCALFMLLAALLVGGYLRLPGPAAPGAALWLVAILAKVFALAWLVPVVLARRWRLAVVIVVLLAASLVFAFLLSPSANREYWLHFLPGQAAGYAEQPSIDDQSLLAFLQRLFEPGSYQVPGLSAEAATAVHWTPPLPLAAGTVRLAAYVLQALAALGALALLIRLDAPGAEAGLYLWVLVCLVLLPHAERYNQVLLLPALAWLWRRGARSVVACAYLLVGLSRLTHLFAVALPWPLGPLGTGFALYATVLLCVALARAFVDAGQSTIAPVGAA